MNSPLRMVLQLTNNSWTWQTNGLNAMDGHRPEKVKSSKSITKTYSYSLTAHRNPLMQTTHIMDRVTKIYNQK
jgi:hypothetical protein